jgi:hypothetical protein
MQLDEKIVSREQARRWIIRRKSKLLRGFR